MSFMLVLTEITRVLSVYVNNPVDITSFKHSHTLLHITACVLFTTADVKTQ